MAVCGVDSRRKNSVINKAFDLQQKYFTHGHSEKRWVTVSSSSLQSDSNGKTVLLKSIIISCLRKAFYSVFYIESWVSSYW